MNEAGAVSELSLRVKYEGPDADRGRMSAVDIGPAIFGIGNAVGRASRILYGDEKRVQVEVRADFEHASFGIEFFALSPTGELLPPLTIEQLSQIASILGLIGGVPGMIAFLRWLAKRKIKEIEQHGDNYLIHVEGDVKDLSVTEFRVFSDPTIRRDMKALVAPLEEDRITGLHIQAGDREPIHITHKERELFEIRGLPDEDLGEDTSVQILEILSPSFQLGNKWYVAQGELKYYVTIEDDIFLAKVERREYRFGNHDALRVEMAVDVSRDEKGHLKFDRRVVRVLTYLPAPQSTQTELLE